MLKTSVVGSRHSHTAPAPLAKPMPHILQMCVADMEKKGHKRSSSPSLSQASTRATGGSRATTATSGSSTGGSSTVGGSSAVGGSATVVPTLLSGAKSKAWQALMDYVGGVNGWTRTDYEKVFGEVDPETPFGSRIWEGLIRLYPWYRAIINKSWLTTDEYVTWLGGYAMPTHFSAKMSAAAIDERPESQPGDQMHPAVFILSTEQHGRVCKSIMDTGVDDAETAVVVRSSANLALMHHRKMAVDESDVANHVWIDGDSVGSVSMVCLKIMISGTRLWSVHFDRVHPYKPFFSKL